MGVQFKSKGRMMVALLDGEIDHHTAKDMREKIDLQASKVNPSVLEIDFSGVKFMDSSGIGLVMGRYKMIRLRGGTLKVTNVPDNISRIMTLSGLGALGVI